MKTDFDALLLVSFGGPEGMEDVIPFLENVLRGRNVPRERMLSVARHYELFDGVSPINQQNRNLIAALEKEFEEHGPALPIYWGNRNWQPLLPDTLRQMASDGIQNALAFVTSGYSSYSSCRQYLQNISDAQAVVGPEAPRVEKLRVFYKHPLFIEANVDHIRAALSQLEDPASAHLVFTAQQQQVGKADPGRSDIHDDRIVIAATDRVFHVGVHQPRRPGKLPCDKCFHPTAISRG